MVPPETGRADAESVVLEIARWSVRDDSLHSHPVTVDAIASRGSVIAKSRIRRLEHTQQLFSSNA